MVDTHRRPVRRPLAVQSNEETGDGKQHGVVVDPPAREIAPRLLPVSLERYPGGFESLRDLVELAAIDADGVAGPGIRVEWDTEERRDRTQGDEAGTDAHGSFGAVRRVDERDVQC